MSGSGCYGHNGADDVALDAALLARRAGTHGGGTGCATTSSPGSLWGRHGDAGQAALGTDGRIVDWSYEL